MKKYIIIPTIIVGLAIICLLSFSKKPPVTVQFEDNSFQKAFEYYYVWPYLTSEPEEVLYPTKEQLESMRALRLDFDMGGSTLNNTYDLKDLDKFPNLIALSIRADTITTEQLEIIGQMEQLEALVLLINKSEVDYSKLRNLKKLKELVISGCNDEAIAMIKDLSNLELLSLNNSRLENLDFLYTHTKLKSLGLHSVEIETISSVNGLEEIKRLIISGVEIKENSEKLFESMDLEDLDINNCEFILSLDFLENMKNLEELLLDNQEVTDMSILKNLESFPKLRRLYLDPEIESNKEFLKEIEPELQKREEKYQQAIKKDSSLEGWKQSELLYFPSTINEMKKYNLYLNPQKN